MQLQRWFLKINFIELSNYWTAKVPKKYQISSFIFQHDINHDDDDDDVLIHSQRGDDEEEKHVMLKSSCKEKCREISCRAITRSISRLETAKSHAKSWQLSFILAVSQISWLSHLLGNWWITKFTNWIFSLLWKITSMDVFLYSSIDT